MPLEFVVRVVVGSRVEGDRFDGCRTRGIVHEFIIGVVWIGRDLVHGKWAMGVFRYALVHVVVAGYPVSRCSVRVVLMIMMGAVLSVGYVVHGLRGLVLISCSCAVHAAFLSSSCFLTIVICEAFYVAPQKFLLGTSSFRDGVS